MKQKSLWILSEANIKKFKYQLFCFPYAGANSSIFQNWKHLFFPEVAVHPIEMPGKGRRFSESPYTSIEPLITDLENWFLKEVQTDYAIFGHSLGALISFELAKRLQISKNPPKLLIVSGCPSPNHCIAKRKKNGPRKLSDSELVNILNEFKQTPDKILENQEFLKIFLPIFRADISIFDNYYPISEILLKCHLLVLGGNNDEEVPLDTLEGWKENTENKFGTMIFEGGHFFLHSHEQLIVKVINEWLIKTE
ncbi:thioesterase II family protein [Candidatus Protochlamydia sp. W-9]|uniref:thioesterase II family protein n=1 Tax=Candidatus Protochlamydia sp. W-9 TaxID=1785087 RepID=UPI00096A546D|nr:thioesterase domain-containing protein [Candidatus Protochlamydia sp. W-9]